MSEKEKLKQEILEIEEQARKLNAQLDELNAKEEIIKNRMSVLNGE